MSKVLISGGAGFIGTHLTAQLTQSGHEVRILDNLSPQIHGAQASFDPPAGVQFVHGDVTDRADWERGLDGIDAVIHLAAETGTGQSMYEIDRYYRVNVQGTALLFDILANKPHNIGNVILASSRSVYGEGAYLCRTCDPAGARCFPQPRTPEQLAAHDWAPRCPTCGGEIEPTATREADKLSPASIYAASKLAQEELVQVACGSMDIPYSILRFQNVYGEGQSLKNPYTGILSIFSTRIRLGLPLPIFEDGEETRDFVHVGDVATAVRLCVEHPIDGVIMNVGAGKSASIMSVARLLAAKMNSIVEPHVTGEYRIGDIRHNHADLSELQRITGFRPEIPLDKGLRRFCDWVLTQQVPADLLDKANAELKARNMMG